MIDLKRVKRSKRVKVTLKRRANKANSKYQAHINNEMEED